MQVPGSVSRRRGNRCTLRFQENALADPRHLQPVGARNPVSQASSRAAFSIDRYGPDSAML